MIDANKVLVETNQFGEQSANYIQSDGILFLHDFKVFSGATTPVNGGSGTGAGYAGPGSIYAARDTGLSYVNTNTKASPTWVVQGNASAIAATLTGFVSGAGSVTSADTVLSAFDKVVGNQAQLQNGQFTPTSETISGAGALSTTKMVSLVNNATGGSYAVTLAAPSSQDGQLKVVKLGTATHTATLAMTNIAGPGFCTLSGTTTLTFTATGDCAIFMAVGAKWQLIGGSAIAS